MLVNAQTLIYLHTASEELSEEDQQLKNELDMLVERLTVRPYLQQANRKIPNSPRVGIRCFPLQAGP